MDGDAHALGPGGVGRATHERGFDALAVEADFLFEELFDAAPGLRIAAICRGDLHHADLDAATERGIAVVRTPARNAQAVAEFAVAQMLALARHTSIGERYVREGQWEDPTDPVRPLPGRELAGATLGIVGFGAIGRAVARIAAGFGMRVLAYDPYVNDAEGVEMTSLEALLAASDFVSMHVPDTPETMGMLDEAHIAAMKPERHQLAVPGCAGGGLVNVDVHEAHPNSSVATIGRAGDAGGDGGARFDSGAGSPGPRSTYTRRTPSPRTRRSSDARGTLPRRLGRNRPTSLLTPASAAHAGDDRSALGPQWHWPRPRRTSR